MFNRLKDVFQLNMVALQQIDEVKILIVDDKPVQQSMTSLLLKQLGHNVSLARDGFEALSSIQDGGCFDVVLVDCEMSLMDGFQAIKFIREMDKLVGKQTTIIGIGSGSISETELSAGMNEYLVKPLNKLKLKAVLGHRIRQKKDSAYRQIPKLNNL